MIHYTLTCEADHAFEGWFRSSADFDTQAASGLITCPVCGSASVSRGVMAPNVQSGRAKDARKADAERQSTTAPAPVASQTQTMMLPDPAQKMMLQALREIRKKVTENATYVGDRFAEEARKMHHGETEVHGIYGEATAEEAQTLSEEGIEFQPLPILPDDRN